MLRAATEAANGVRLRHTLSNTRNIKEPFDHKKWAKKGGVSFTPTHVYRHQITAIPSPNRCRSIAEAYLRVWDLDRDQAQFLLLALHIPWSTNDTTIREKGTLSP